MTSRPGRLVVWCGIVPTLVAALLCLWQPSFLARVELGVYDRLVRLAGTKPPSGRVVIVDVDERSLSKVGQWPWRRELIATLITRLRDLGASTIAIDIMFAEAERHQEDPVSPDAALADTLGGGRVVLGYALTFDQPPDVSSTCVQHPLSLAVMHHDDEETDNPFFRATKAICNLTILTGAAAGSGFLNAAPDADGILRRVPLLVELNARVYPGLALAAVTAASDTRNATLRIANVNGASLAFPDTSDNSLQPAGFEVPLDGKSNLLVRYRGVKRTFPYVSAADVLSGEVRSDVIKDKLVFLGTTALGTREVVATPLDTLFTGVEVQATVADNLLQQDFFHRPEHAVTLEALAVLAFGIAAALLNGRFGLARGAVGTVALVAAVWGASVSLMSTDGTVLSPLFPTLALTSALAAMTAAGLTVEGRRADHAGEEKGAAQRLMVQSLLSLVETRDAETGRHSRRTQQYTRILAEALVAHPAFSGYLTPQRIELLSVLAPLHDIGKVGIPDRVLQKPGPLDNAELELMRKHPVYGRDVIANAERAAGVRDDVTLAIAKDVVYTHHEKWDGTGYPQGLRGADIPIAGRIIALVDVYDAMLSPRPYHRAMTHDEVIAIIRKGRGTHFDPDVVDACLKIESALRILSEERALVTT